MEFSGLEGLKIMVVDGCWGGVLPETGKTPKRPEPEPHLLERVWTLN